MGEEGWVFSSPSRIRIALFDSDGVLTDGAVWMDDAGSQWRRFDIKDGLGLRMLADAGIVTGVVSSSPVVVVRGRMEALGATEIHLGVKDKRATVDEILSRHGFSWSELLYMGDDLPDLPVLGGAGIAAAPADAALAVRAAVHRITSKPGGHGAVREICDWILLSRKSE